MEEENQSVSEKLCALYSQRMKSIVENKDLKADHSKGNIYELLYHLNSPEVGMRALIDQCFYDVVGCRPRHHKREHVSILNQLKSQLSSKKGFLPND